MSAKVERGEALTGCRTATFCRRGAILRLLLAGMLLLSAASGKASARIEVPFSAYEEGRFTPSAHGLMLKRMPKGFLPELRPAGPELTLALSGGGARGLAHIGVLKVLAEEGIPVERIMGTSMGAIIGGLYAAGYAPEEMASIVERLNWGSLFSDAPSRRNLFLAQKEAANRDLITFHFRDGEPYIPDALVNGQRLYMEMLDVMSRAPFSFREDMFRSGRVELGVLATDLSKGEGLLIRDGCVVLAMRSALALPVIFRAVRLNGHILVDGGAIENIPVRAAYEMDAHLVVAVDCVTSETPDLDPDMPWEVADQVTTLMTAPNDSLSRALADLVVTPELPGVTNMSFDESRRIIGAGEQAMRAMLPALRERLAQERSAPLLVTKVSGVRLEFAPSRPEREPPFAIESSLPGNYTTTQLNGMLEELLHELKGRGYAAAALDASLKGEVLEVQVDLGKVDDLRITGASSPGRAIALREVRMRLGEPLRRDELLKTLTQIHATGQFTTAYSVVEHQRGGGLTVHLILEEAPLPSVGFGLGFDSDRGSRYLGEFILSNPIPHVGQEMSLIAKYGEKDRRFAMELRADRLARTYIGWRGTLEYLERSQTDFDKKGHGFREVEVWTSRAQAELMFNLQTWGRLNAGLAVERVADNFDGISHENYYSFLSFGGTLDTRDKRPFPSSGTYLSTSYTSYLPPLGSERGFSTFQYRGEVVSRLLHRLVGKYGLSGGVAEVTTPSTHRFALGGLTNFPALKPYRFLALRYVAGTVTLRYDLISRLIAETYLLGRYDIAAFGSRKDWRPTRKDLIQSYALGIALDTRLGPLELWGAFSPESSSGPSETRVMVNLGYRF